MENKTIENIHANRNKSRIGGEGIYSKERAELFSRWIGRDKNVLELGCRDGSLTKLFISDNRITGVDIDKNALELFKKNLGGKGYYIDINNEWPFNEKEFDVIVASEILEHLYLPEKTIKKVAETLKDNGIFIGSVPNAFSLANRIRLFLAKPNKTALSDPTHVHQFVYGELENMLKKYFSEVKLVPLTRYKFLSKIFPSLFSFLIVFYCKK